MMRRSLVITLLASGIFLGFAPGIAHADTLNALKSACRTGVYAACSEYNAAIIARSAAHNPVLHNGFDPFSIQPATHTGISAKDPPRANPQNTAKSADLLVTGSRNTD